MSSNNLLSFLQIDGSTSFQYVYIYIYISADVITTNGELIALRAVVMHGSSLFCRKLLGLYQAIA